MKKYLFHVLLLSLFSSLSKGQVYTFTTCGATGVNGPNQSQVNTAYASTNLNGAVTINTAGVQSWTVPSSGNYSILVNGAQGGHSIYNGGLGSRMSGQFTFTGGQVLQIVVGQKGLNESGDANRSGGGGGGSFVYSGSTLYIAAGGGGGKTGYTSGAYNFTSVNANTTTTGNYGSGWSVGTGGSGGSSGNGGSGTSYGGGGAGWLTNGGDAFSYSGNQQGFSLSGSWIGGTATSGGGSGGFGGGGAGGIAYGGGGGGGGYSGGGGGTDPGSGGGGGSYNSGINQVNTPSVNVGDGSVIITRLSGVFVTQTNPIACNGMSTAVLTASSSVGTAPFTYSWSTGATSATISGLAAGSYTCFITDVTSTTYSSSYVVTQPAPVTSTLTSQTNVTCNGGSNGAIAISAGGGTAPYTYSWTPSIGTASYVSGLTAGMYTCTILDYNNCQTTRTIALTQPNAPSIIAFATNPSVCMGGTTSLIGGGAVSYTWSGGVINGVAFSPTVSANYVVTGFDSQGCPGYAQVSISVNPRPTVSVSGSSAVCQGASTSLSASGANTYTWSTGATGSLTTISPTTAAIYTVTGSNTFACTNSATLSVSIYTLPTISALLSNTVVCSGAPVTMIGLGANTFTWTGGVTNGMPFNPTTTTVYTLTGTDGNGCVNSTTRTVVVNPLPIVAIGGSSAICQGYQANLYVTGANSYTWSNSSNTASITVSPLTTTNYSVTGVDANGCRNSDTLTLIVNPSPTVFVTASNSVICSGDPVQLVANGANSYTWAPLNLNFNTITLTPSVTTTYTLDGEANGCVNSTVVTVSVNATPTISLNHSVTTCAYNTITLTVSGASSYTWSNGSNSPTTAVTPTSTTVYSLSASNNNGCIKKDSVVVIANPTPILNVISANNTICEGDSATLTAIGANSYTWSTSDTLSTIVVNPQTSTNYTVSGINIYGCISSFNYQLNVTTCTGLINYDKESNSLLKIYPNPNDGAFTIETTNDTHLTLINELGQVIRIIDCDQSNNRHISITNLSQGVYFISGESEGKILREKLIVTN